MESSKKAPVGTQSYWESTGQTWIKTHDNTVFDNTLPAWIVMPNDVPVIFKEEFKKLDEMGREIYKFKEPVEGELWLDHEFEDFTTRSGKKFKSQDFKQYSNWSGKFAGYFFSSELAKRLLWDKIDLNAKIADALVEANEDKKTQLLKEGQPVHEKKIFLTPEEVAGIKKRIRETYKYDDSQKLTIEDVKDIREIVGKILGFLRKGEKFTGEEAVIYDACQVYLEKLKSGPYENIHLIREEMKEKIGLMNDTFKENWGIRESYKKKVDEAFTDYISKYRKQIEADELEVFKQKIGVSLYAPPKEFYTALKKSNLFKHIDVDSYIGKYIPHPGSKYEDVTLVSISPSYSFNEHENYLEVKYRDIDGRVRSSTMREIQLELSIMMREGDLPDIDIPLKLRFSSMYNKDLDGTFLPTDLTLLETMEKIADYLPKGHFMTNRMLNKIRKESYFRETDNSYAHYSWNPIGSKGEIYLSNNAANSAEMGIVDINSGSEIATVLIHEIGHAVSQKLGRRNSKEYRKFVVECGWSWEQFQFGDKNHNYHATGDDKDITRFGTKSKIELFTDYAHKSPEEAFAEHYSLYSMYKPEIDKYLETGNDKYLIKHSMINTKELSHVKYQEHSYNPMPFSRTEEIDSVLTSAKRDLKDHIRTGVIDPYYNNLGNISQRDIDPTRIAYAKRTDNRTDPEPVFTVFDYQTGKHDILENGTIDDAGIHYSNKYLRRLSPTFSISKECYKHLVDKGYTHDDIREYCLSKVGDQKIPAVSLKQEVDVHTGLVQGLNYRGKVIDKDILVKEANILRQMRLIWESDALKKALVELGFEKSINYPEATKRIQQQLDPEGRYPNTLSSMFSWAKNKIKSLMTGTMKKYADTIIMNQQGKILLLQRSYQDDFMPGKWGLPGGKIELGESPIDAAARETWEETGLDLRGKLVPLKMIEKEDCEINYFQAVYNEPTPFILDNDEHYRMQWVGMDELGNYDLILDLKETLFNLEFVTLSPVLSLDFSDLSRIKVEDLFNYKQGLIDGFNRELVSVEDYVLGMDNIKKAAYHIVKSAFDKGEVSTEVYYAAREKAGLV